MSSAGLTAVGAPRVRARAAGWWGMLIFCLSEATLLGAILGSYYYLRFTNPHWLPAGTPKPTLLDPLVLLAVLAASLVPLYAARARAFAGERGRAAWLLAATAAVQAAYFAVQIELFVSSLERFTPAQSAYASAYYVLLGADHAHVAVGLLLDAWLLLRIPFRLTRYRLVALDAATLYWTVVVAITVAATLTAVSPSL